MVQGRLGAQHHPAAIGRELTPADRRLVPSRRDRTIAIVWLAYVTAAAVALLAALTVTFRDPSTESVARWALAVFFLGAPALWVTRRYRRELRRGLRR